MDFITGRPDHIEDYLGSLKTGTWFGWSDAKNKIYSNLIINDGSTKPSESDCTTGLAAMQAAWDLEFDSINLKEEQSIQILKISLMTSIIMG